MSHAYSADPYTWTQYQMHGIGTKFIDPDNGDIFRYAKVGGSNIVAGKMMTAPTQKTNHHNRPAYAAVTQNGVTRKVTLTLGATAATANEYAGGYLVANDVDPEGETYKIVSHPAAGSSETLEVTVERPFVSSITTSSEFTLVHNAWNGVIVNAAFTLRAAGVPLVDATAGYFGWLKTKGVAAVLIGTAATLGADLICDGSGGVTDRTDALGASAEPVVAIANITLGVATEYNPVTLCID